MQQAAPQVVPMAVASAAHLTLSFFSVPAQERRGMHVAIADGVALPAFLLAAAGRPLPRRQRATATIRPRQQQQQAAAAR